MTKKIYIAGPLFSDAERAYLESMVEYLTDNLGLDPHDDFFLPHRDAGVDTMSDVFDADVDAVLEADIIVAWLDGITVDPGTAVEIGMGYSNGVVVIGLLTDRRSNETNMNNMIRFSCAHICHSLDEVCDRVAARLSKNAKKDSVGGE